MKLHASIGLRHREAWKTKYDGIRASVVEDHQPCLNRIDETVGVLASQGAPSTVECVRSDSGGKFPGGSFK